MRFAISAVAAASGLLLLGLSFYGQPAVYLRAAGEQWNALMDRPSADQSAQAEADQPTAPAADQPIALNAGPDAPTAQSAGLKAPTAQGAGTNAPAAQNAGTTAVAHADRHAAADALYSATRDDDAADARAARLQQEAADARAARLQQEVVRLQQELAARQQAPTPAPAQPAQTGPAPTGPATPPPAAPPQIAAPAPPTLVVTAPPDSRPLPAPPRPAPPVAAAPLPVPPPIPVPERRDVAAEAPPSRVERQPEPPKAEPSKPELAKAAPVRVEPPRVEPPRAESPRAEPARQAAPKVVIQKPVPAPPPLPQPSPPRQEADDTQSVLARLRQLAPSAPPVQQADTPPPPDVTRPRPANSPLIPRLGAARTALTNGQIEDARRLLQQAQLQLVFGPVDGAGDDTPNAGKGATDVARALDALSANDVPLSRRYIDVAVGDLSGMPMNPPIQESARRASGYAPAYPPR